MTFSGEFLTNEGVKPCPLTKRYSSAVFVLEAVE